MMQNMGINIQMLTGDASGPALHIAAAVGLSEDCVRAALLPDDKLHLVSPDHDHETCR